MAGLHIVMKPPFIVFETQRDDATAPGCMFCASPTHLVVDYYVGRRAEQPAIIHGVCERCHLFAAPTIRTIQILVYFTAWDNSLPFIGYARRMPQPTITILHE